MSENRPDTEERTATNTEDEVIEPPRYKVLMLNDNYTTMDFVVEVLEKIFNKTASEATQIMLNVHKKGSGICGIYTAEVAETKVALVHHLAQQNGFPLKCSMEEV